MKALISVIVSVVVLAIVVASTMVAGCENPFTPAGCEGYVYCKPIAFGEGGYVGTNTGPKRYGMSWRLFINNLDMRTETYSENFNILAKDDLNISFQVHLKMSLERGGSKVIMENYGGADWYARFVKEQFRTYVRNSVKNWTSREAKENRDEMRGYVLSQLLIIVKDTPFIVEDVVVGNIDYPKLVQDAVEQKIARQQELEEREYQLSIAKKDAEIKEVEAKGIAKAQDIINKTLTTDYLRHEWIQALEKSANTPNTTIIYVPVGNDGLPIFKDVSK